MSSPGPYPSSASGQEWHTFAHAVEHKLHPDDKTCFNCLFYGFLDGVDMHMMAPF